MRLVIKRGGSVIGIYGRNPNNQTTYLKTKQNPRHPGYGIANADDLNKKYVGEGTDVSTDRMENDAFDAKDNEYTELESDTESVMKTINNSNQETTENKNEENIVNDTELKENMIK